MRSFYDRCLLACAMLFASTSFAQGQPSYKPVMFKGVDVAPFIEFAKADLRVVTAPFKLYHWDQSGQASYWNSFKSGHNPAFAQALKNSATIPFRALGRPGGASNMYGSGFYLAIDPVATRDFGGYNYSNSGLGSNPNQIWQLTEVTVPVGVTFLDLNSPNSFAASKTDLSPILKAFNCQSAYSANDFFTGGGSRLDPACVDLVRFVYNTTLKIDLFSYSYNSAPFLVCDRGLSKRPLDRERAMVITNGRWITPNSVFVMHSSTTEDIETRRLIQTLFIYSKMSSDSGGSFDPSAAKDAIIDLLTEHPDYVIQSAPVTCSGSRCALKIYACPRGTKFTDDNADTVCGTDTIDLPAPVTDLIRNAQLDPYGLLWPDLEGQKKSSPETIDAYLNTNRLGCDGQERYVKVKSDAIQTGN